MFDWATVGGIGAFKELHKYAAKNWVRYEPGSWARQPTVVRGHWRGKPSGGQTWVRSYVRSGRWAPAQEVSDIAKRAARRRHLMLAGRGSGVLTYGTTFLDQLVEDRGRPDLDAGERAGRAVAAAVGGVVGGVIGSGVGQAVGAKVKGWLL